MRIDELIERGRKNLQVLDDKKSYVSLSDMYLLIQAGATIETQDRQQAGGGYLQEVVWKDDIWYVTVTNNPLSFLN